MLYIQYYIKTVHFWLKYNGFATVRKTTKLIEGGHRGFQDYGILLRFFTFFYVFLKIQKVVTFYVFCRVSYVFSNYGPNLLLVTNKSYMGFRLTPRSITLDDLELHEFEFSVNFEGFRRFWTQQQLIE